LQNWIPVSLGDIVDFTNGGAWSENEYSAHGVPVARVSDFVGNTIDLSICKYLPKSSLAKYSKHRLHKGDLVLATVGSHPNQPNSVVGRPVRVPASADGALLNQNAVRLAPKCSAIDQEFLAFVGQSPYFRDFIVSRARGSANQVRIAIGTLKEMAIRLPPLGYGSERVVTSKGCLLPNLKTCARKRTRKQAGV